MQLGQLEKYVLRNNLDVTITIISKHSKAIQKLVKFQMEMEFQKAGFDIWGNTAEAEYELRLTELERKCLENPDLDIEVMYFELFHPHFA